MEGLRNPKNDLRTKASTKPITTQSQVDGLDHALTEIIKKRMSRGAPNLVEVGSSLPGINQLEKEYTESIGGNLYVGNLHPKVSEEILFREFCKFGPIESIKVMHPRNEEDINRGKNCGFIKFIEREDAELAMQELEGIFLFGYEIKLGWGKAMPKSANSNQIQYLTINHIAPGLQEASQLLMINPNFPKIYVNIPENEAERDIIDCVSRLVACEGHLAEEDIKIRQKNNPRLAFLFDPNHKHFIYYKWRTYSYSQGDSERAWRIEPFQMFINGPVWIPPPLPQFDKEKAKKNKEISQRDSDKDNEDLEYFTATGKNKSRNEDEEVIVRLPYQLKREYTSILDELTVKQTDVCNAMIFVMENNEYCKPIIRILNERIIECKDYDKLCGLLYLLTDILFNSGSKIIPNAKNFRNELERYLPEIFESIRNIKGTFGKITARKLEIQCEEILKNWETWRVFDSNYIQGLGMVLKIPKNFNSKMFESDETLNLFQNDYTYSEKAKTVALDIARLNYRRLTRDSVSGKINLKLMCHDKGINLGEKGLTEDDMIKKINTLTYGKLITDFNDTQDVKSEAVNPDSNKKNINKELMRIYDMYSHISRINSQLKDHEEGLPLTQEDIERFGLEEDLQTISGRAMDSSKPNLSNAAKVQTDIGEMRVFNSNIDEKQSIMGVDVKEEEEPEDKGQRIANFSWLECMKEPSKDQREYKWFSANVHKDNYKKIKFAKEEKKAEVEERIQNTIPISSPASMIPMQPSSLRRGRGVRGMRGSRGSMAAQNFETHQPPEIAQTRSVDIEHQSSSSNSDMSD